MANEEEEKAPIVYAIRLAAAATHVLVSEHERLEALSGSTVADRWRDGVLDTIQTLATLPQRCPMAREDALLPDETVRQILYSRRRGGPAWRILFTVEEGGEDPPTVRIQHIRHSAQAPMTEWPGEDADG